MAGPASQIPINPTATAPSQPAMRETQRETPCGAVAPPPKQLSQSQSAQQPQGGPQGAISMPPPAPVSVQAAMHPPSMNLPVQHTPTHIACQHPSTSFAASWPAPTPLYSRYFGYSIYIVCPRCNAVPTPCQIHHIGTCRWCGARIKVFEYPSD